MNPHRVEAKIKTYSFGLSCISPESLEGAVNPVVEAVLTQGTTQARTSASIIPSIDIIRTPHTPCIQSILMLLVLREPAGYVK